MSDARDASGVILGMQVRPRDRKLIKTLASAHWPVVAVYQAEEDTDRFWMRIRRIA